MITLLILLIILGVFFMILCGGAFIILDPIIGILIIIGIFKLIKKLTGKDKKKGKK